MKSIGLFIFMLMVPLAALAGPSKLSLEQRIVELEGLVASLQSQVASQAALLHGVSRLADPYTGKDTLRFSGMNVQVVNGTGSTYEHDGTGNLIIGYNELRNPRAGETCDSTPEDCNRRDGSHNLVVGYRNNYSQHGGIVVGLENEISGPFSSVSGGWFNLASGGLSSVSGGDHNTASGNRSSVSGGVANTASGLNSAVGGGFNKNAGFECWEGDSEEDC